ncbi:30S ribosomal protein S27ae [Candidatus Woesearchaeota archaeon]|nr:MAG: 30S ribosomal protein S27ae [Candidatus Woesearchaeota archaeon]
MADKKGIWTRYSKDGEKLKRALKSCPKCGQGHFMAQHKNRDVCGGCGYTEYKKKEEKKD